MGWLGAIGSFVGSVGPAVAEVAMAGAMVYGAATAGSAAKKIPSSLPAPIKELEKEVPNVEDASKLAAAKIKEKRKDINRSRTIFSSPLGQVDEADISVKTLLGK